MTAAGRGVFELFKIPCENKGMLGEKAGGRVRAARLFWPSTVFARCSCFGGRALVVARRIRDAIGLTFSCNAPLVS